MIRAGTLIAGDTELGVRLVSILLALPMSCAVYRAAAILFGGRRVAATATILLNVTLMAAVGTLIVTPDAPLLVASSFVLFFLAKVLETGRGAWWLAVGAAVGAALLSKYTALFFGPAILIWLVGVPKLRRWLISPWPYLGGLVALAMFSPVILWNADHHWVSFIKQIGRARIEDFRPAFIAELIPTQIAFATPLVFILGAMGLYALLRRDAGAFAGARCSSTRCSGPSWRISSGIRCMPASRPTGSRRSIRRLRSPPRSPPISRNGSRASSASSISAGAGPRRSASCMFVAADRAGQYRRAHGLSPRRHRAQRRRRLARTGRRRSRRCAARVGATCVLAPDYGTTGWLAFYLPKGTCVAQQTQRIRWVNMPEPDRGATRRQAAVRRRGAARRSRRF